MNWDIIGNMLLVIVLAGLGVAGVLAVLIWKKNLSMRITYIRLVTQLVAFAALFYFFTFTIPLLYVLIVVFRSDNCCRTSILRLALPAWFCHGLDDFS